jgi:hypothetical protein
VTDGIVVIVDDGLARNTRRRRSLKTGACNEFRIVEIVIAHAYLRLHVAGAAAVRGGERSKGCGGAIPLLVQNDVLNEIRLIEIFELQFGNRPVKLIGHGPQDRIGRSRGVLTAIRGRRRQDQENNDDKV